jgi:hypothetical protein
MAHPTKKITAKVTKVIISEEISKDKKKKPTKKSKFAYQDSLNLNKK